MATSDSYRRDESMRPGAMSGTATPATGASGVSTGGPKTDDSVLDHPRETVGQVADQAQQKLMQVAESAQDTAKSHLGGQLEQVSEALGSVADAMTSVSQQLREKDQTQLASLTDQAAQRVDHLSGYVKGRDVDQLIGDVESFARRQPMVFVGGAFVLGLMAARFLKSSRPEPEMPYRPYMGSGTGTGMRSYAARPGPSGGYGDARRGPSYAGGMASSEPMRRPSDYSNGGFPSAGTSGTSATRPATNRPGVGTSPMPAGAGSTPDTMRTATSAPMPSGSPAHVGGSGSMAGTPKAIKEKRTIRGK